MRADWIECDKFLPDKDGVYLVTTANGKIRLDRFVGGSWGLCQARHTSKGRYRLHLAWMFLPRPAQFDEKGNIKR